MAHNTTYLFIHLFHLFRTLLRLNQGRLTAHCANSMSSSLLRKHVGGYSEVLNGWEV